MPTPERFEPVPFQIVTDLRQLKAFTDPIRNRILHILANQEATNQQLAALIGEPQAKVLHHVRFLLDCELIVLVEQRVHGGNVEKLYRSTARVYGFRPSPDDASSLSEPVSRALFVSITQELAASLQLWPDQPLYWETRRMRLSPERAAEFDHRLVALIAEFWGELDTPIDEDTGTPVMALATAVYRFPGN